MRQAHCYDQCGNYNEIETKKNKRTHKFTWKTLAGKITGNEKQNPL